MTRFSCVCGREFKVADEQAGKKGKCPACGAINVIPRPTPEIRQAKSSIGRRRGIVWAAALMIALLVGLAFGRSMVPHKPTVEPPIVAIMPAQLQPQPADDEGLSAAIGMANLDLPNKHDGSSEFVTPYKLLLKRAAEYYSEDPETIGLNLIDTTKNLRERGRYVNSLKLLLGSIKCAQAAKERKGPSWDKIKIRSFCSIYEFFRVEQDLDPLSALERIDEMEKL